MSHALPPPLMTSEPGSFARHTFVERKPTIIQQVIGENAYPVEIVEQLEALRSEIAGKPVQPLGGSNSDVAFWNREWGRFRGKTWLELTWYFAETYFYRRLLEAVGYFQPGPWHRHDPFGNQKTRQEKEAVAWFQDKRVPALEASRDAALVSLLHSSLWGNRTDLSNLTVSRGVRDGMVVDRERHQVIIDHTEQVAALISSGADRIDFVNDNTGRELLLDLALAEFLLSERWARQIVFHLKENPFFVSDAMPVDVEETLAALLADTLESRLSDHLAAGRLVLRDHPFWTTCLMFRQMPPDLVDDLTQSDLVIIKGDVNYRRLLDDRHWPPEASLESIVTYFPSALLVLRTLKGEIVVGLQPGQADELAAQDPTWMINGKRGIIQLAIADN